MKKFFGLLLSAVMLVSLFWISPVEAWAATTINSLVINGDVPAPSEGQTFGDYVSEVSDSIGLNTDPGMSDPTYSYYVSDNEGIHIRLGALNVLMRIRITISILRLMEVGTFPSI